MISVEHCKINILVLSWTPRLLTCAGIGLSGEFQGSVEPVMTGKTGSHMDHGYQYKDKVELPIVYLCLSAHH